jgi:hypothetical protein
MSYELGVMNYEWRGMRKYANVQIRKGEGRNAFNQLMLREAATWHVLQIRASGGNG